LALELADLEAALHDHAHALLEGLRDVLGRLAPYRAGQEQRVAVLPLAGLPVELTRRRGEPEVGHGRSGRGETQLGMVEEVADHGDDGVAGHGFAEKVGGLLVAVARRLPTSGRVLHRRGLRPVDQRASGRTTLVRITDSDSESCRPSSLTVSGLALI